MKTMVTAPLRLCAAGFSVLLAGLLTTGAFAQPDDVLLDTDAMLRELRAIKAKKQEGDEAWRRNIVQSLSAACVNGDTAIEFYCDTIRMTQFAGDDREQSEFRMWRKAHADRLKSDDEQAACRAHLAYLTLTVQRTGETNAHAVLSGLIS
jgi:hypothetical protein